MAVNLVSQILQFLNPDMIARLSSALGVDATKTQAAAGAAVPGLLSGLLGTAQQPGGPERLTSAVNQQSGALDGIAKMLGGGGDTSALVDQGSQLVNSLLGQGQQSALEGAVGKFAGLGQNAIGPLLGAIAPMVLGVIGKQAGPGGFDAGSLVTLLSSQKDNIAKAMPGGFGSLLQGSGLLDSLGSMAGAATGAASAATDKATQAAAAAAAQTKQYAAGAGSAARSGMNWVFWAIPIALVLGLIWFFMGNASNTPPAPDTVITGSIPVVVIRGVDVTKELGGSLTEVSSSLAKVTDAASAQAAVPDLKAVGAKLDTIKTAISAATPEQKTALSGMIAPAVTGIRATFDKVMAIPGVSEALKPTADELSAKLSTLIS